MVEQSRCEYAEDDRQRLAETRRQQYGEQHCLVANLGKGDNGGGGKEGSQHGARFGMARVVRPALNFANHVAFLQFSTAPLPHGMQ